MPRGFQRDKAATDAARFDDRRSFVSQPKRIKGECDKPQAHLVLYGLKDKSPIRRQIFQLNREANGGINRCWKCGIAVIENPKDGLDYMGIAVIGEWDHPRNKPGERCDCPENGRVACPRCHRERHPKPQFGRSKIQKEMS